MIPEKKTRIMSIIGMSVLMLVFAIMSLFEGTWSLPRILLLVAGMVLWIVGIIQEITKILKE